MLQRIYDYVEYGNLLVYEGPNKSSIDGFWRMVWQEDVRTIAMLTKLTEGAKVCILIIFLLSATALIQNTYCNFIFEKYPYLVTSERYLKALLWKLSVVIFAVSGSIFLKPSLFLLVE